MVVIIKNMEKLFEAEYTEEALEQLAQLSVPDRSKIIEAINVFEKVGIAYKNINNLKDGLYEIKPKNVRAYFRYYKNKIIIVGFIVLKKTQKAPKRYIEQANNNINRYIKEIENG